MVLRKLEACDTAYVGWVYTFLSDASRDESEFLLRLYVESFCAILEHSQLVFPNVELSEDASEVDKLQLAGKLQRTSSGSQRLAVFFRRRTS